MNLELEVPAVRDLAWVLGAPGLPKGGRSLLLDAECREILAAHESRLLALDREPGPLVQWLEQRAATPLLGRYFEALLGFWISELLGARRVIQGLPVLSGKKTLGELDFVFEDRLGRLCHWEASVKFYLCTAQTREEALRPEAYLGTMTRDRLDRKLRLLLDKQLGMAETPEGREALKQAGFEGPIESRALMKGALFYPWDHAWPREVVFPNEISSSHLRGWWAKELPPGDAWVELDRRRWLSPFRGGAGFAPLSRGEMQARISSHFEQARTAMMIAALGRNPATGLWGEKERGLVVHPGWPWRDTSLVPTKQERADK